MNKPVKRVAAIHDLSGFGRASLTAIIPILSTMGIQVCPMPTAVLSSHTGGFNGYSFVDLTDSMIEYKNHWKQLNIDFDCIYSGFLGSTKQIDIISEFIDDFGTDDNIVVVDPVMGDNGELYDTMDSEMIVSMKKLVCKADIITPNFTEAVYLLDKNYDLNISEKEIKEYLIELSSMGPDVVIMTSVPESKTSKNTSVIAYDRKTNKFWKVTCKYIPAYFPGTGDCFTSVIVGSLLQGDSLPIALDRGVQFITACIRASYGFDYPHREGVLLERVLQNLNMPVMVSSYELI
ncbi:pyridoxine kinase [Clostridium tepidiprofundi DSM 19306]|uniref:pyridoxal kinase n=1 Tax=Clostridium tepidiprofundi DSM 19306 TaxID=1121338 RepID=A0A151AV96_9CLOT|nr:pyridoxamine kinase [Clostridium tepidiprofundi]KYH31483.1 pyridoxine kinase [Clostridium tepidiprofundi DSM 19306]